MARRHFINNRNSEIAVGLGLFIAAVMLLHDAFEGRGRQQPLFMRFISTP